MPTQTFPGGVNDGAIGTTTSHDRNGLVGRNDATTAKGNALPGGGGVFGASAVPDGAGVLGINTATGFGVSGVGLIGVWGGSTNGVGVLGVSAPPGVKGGDGVQGITNSEQRNGVYGRNDSTTARGNADPAGNGVLGFSRVPDAAGVLGVGTGGAVGLQGASSGHAIIGQGGQFGVTGRGSVIGVWGIGDGTGWAGQFSGPVYIAGTTTIINPSGECLHAETQSPTVAAIAGFQTNAASNTAAVYGKHADPTKAAGFFEGSVVVTGNVSVNGDIVLTGAADCAEEFDIADVDEAAPGTLMIVGETGDLEPCTAAYDARVVGVVSGAGSYRPGLLLDRRVTGKSRRPIALLGKVFCKVDAAFGPIASGDLLTSSPTPGHAMRVGDRAAAFGAVIGKALAQCADGRGMIPVLVTLQ
jgi:hypothetical protein